MTEKHWKQHDFTRVIIGGTECKIDSGIASLIEGMNQVGVRTLYSCEGWDECPHCEYCHGHESHSTVVADGFYVKFKNNHTMLGIFKKHNFMIDDTRLTKEKDMVARYPGKLPKEKIAAVIEDIRRQQWS